MKYRLKFVIALLTVVAATQASAEDALSQPISVPAQPLLSHVHRLSEALEVVGAPLDEPSLKSISAIKTMTSPDQVSDAVQTLFDPLCLAVVDVQESGPPAVAMMHGSPKLIEQGWQTYLVKVINRPHRTGRLLVESPNAKPLPHSPANEVESRWMQISAFEGQPMRANLSGLALEYRVIQVYSRDAGRKSAVLEFNVTGDPAGDADLAREWRFDEGPDGWNPLNQVDLDASGGSLNIKATGDDPSIGVDVEHRGGPMVLRFWAKTETDGIGQVFWWTKDLPQATADRQVNFLVHPGKEHLYEVPFNVDGELAGVRLDPLVKPGEIRIDWIDLYSAQRSENWSKLPMSFEAEPVSQLTFRVIDDSGVPSFAKFEIRDSNGRIYPAQSKRLAPDFFFQRHIYRGDGESLSLPPGDYTAICSRGPETISETKKFTIGEGPSELVYRVNRWVDPSAQGWWSGDHHIHAAGCLHYQNPTQGVQPQDMIRHIMGEDLKVGCCLTWGPCFDYQKRFFTGGTAVQSQYPYTLRYDIEVSGFGSHNSGHLNLLNLKRQIYPGGMSKNHWPTLGLNTLRWAKKQGAICGPAHSSIGLSRFVGRVAGTENKDGPHSLPNFNIPAFDGIGANEFIVDVTHEVPGVDGEPVPAVDFISTMNTERVAEWNMWYHVLNCGFRVAASGETDFPCMSGERVGIGRVYAQVDGLLTFEKWIQSIANGRSYVSDGLCHLLNLSAKGEQGDGTVRVGLDGSELKLDGPQNVSFSIDAAALLNATEDVSVELVINGYPVETQQLRADGSLKTLKFEHEIRESCWVAIRVFPNAHTNPIYVVVDEQPVRGSVDSARWCLAGVEECWKSKHVTYAEKEQEDAVAAYDHAREVFRKRIDSMSK